MSTNHYKVQADPRSALLAGKSLTNSTATNNNNHNQSINNNINKPLSVNNVRIDIDNKPQDKVSQVTDKVNEIQSVLKSNLELAIDRGDKLSEMDEKAEQLMMDSNQFANKSRNVRKMMCKRNARFMILGGVILAIVIGLIVWFATTSSSTTTTPDTTTAPAP